MGFPQGVIDLQHAIDFVSSDGEMGGCRWSCSGTAGEPGVRGGMANARPEVAVVVSAADSNSTEERFDSALGDFEGDVLTQTE